MNAKLFVLVSLFSLLSLNLYGSGKQVAIVTESSLPQPTTCEVALSEDGLNYIISFKGKDDEVLGRFKPLSGMSLDEFGQAIADEFDLSVLHENNVYSNDIYNQVLFLENARKCLDADDSSDSTWKCIIL